ncbi:MAG TPA: serine/threonine-protein kinase [Ktedonobacteraceae bacterium]
MRRCADMADCGYDNRDNDHFCRACALPLLGTALAGRYVVEALVSKGGYAAVFRGVDQHLSRRIAIKVLLPSKTTATEQEHFLREARIAAVLDHPNIAPILDYGKDGPSVFLVMPLYTAGSLRNRLATVNGPLLPAETVTNFHQLANALFYAHTRLRPVIHRDIKPENILIHQEDRRLIITDFGIARSLEPGARIGKTVTVRGTVGYMAPEQTSGVVDPRSDQFGCGVVLYEMLTGYHPFDALGGPVRPPSMFNHELPTSVDGVVLRALSARPEDRFADMQELVQAFDQTTRSASNTAFRLASQSQSQYIPAEPRGSASASFNNVNPPTQRAGNNGDSSAHQRAVRQVNSSSARERCLEGDQFLKLQQYSQALHAYEDALNLDPLNFHAWNGKGTALYSQGNYKRAYDAYQRATEIDSENAVVWVSAGLALNRLKRFPQSLLHFERALKIDSTYVAAWNGKADAQLDMNMPEEAIESYEMALHHDEQSFQAWNGLGNARSILRDFAGAIEAYERALLANPRSAVAWCNKAEALIRHGHARAALDALHEATELDRSYARAWTLKAEVYELLGNTQEAQKARKRAKPWGLMN